MKISSSDSYWTARTDGCVFVAISVSPEKPYQWEWTIARWVDSRRGSHAASLGDARRDGINSLVEHLRKKAQELLNEAAEFERLLSADPPETIKESATLPPDRDLVVGPKARPVETPPAPPEQSTPGVSRYERAAAEVDAVLERQRKARDEG